MSKKKKSSIDTLQRLDINIITENTKIIQKNFMNDVITIV